MRNGLERYWVSLLDSSSWRRIATRPTMRRILRSPSFKRLDHARRRALAARATRNATSVDSVEKVCLMVGHAKSGGTMLGAFLDAHPRIAFADELDILDHVSAGFGREGIFHLIVKAARREAMKGRVTARRLQPYSFAVPGQWQGKTTEPRVVGESKAGIATQRLGADPELLTLLCREVSPSAVRLIHVIRNPCDPIAAMTMRSGRSLSSAIDRYFANCDILQALYARTPPALIHPVRYEDLVADPAEILGGVSAHLGVAAPDDWLAACSAIVRPHIRSERLHLRWEAGAVSEIAERASAYPFLSDYAFDDLDPA